MGEPAAKSGWRRFAFIALGFVLLELALILFFSLDTTHKDWLKESGPIEMGSIAFYLLGVCVFLISFVAGKNRKFDWRGAVLTALLAGREADFQNRFTTEGVFRTSYYFRAQVPLLERIITLLVLAFIGYVVISFLVLYLSDLLRGLRKGTTWVLLGGFAVMMLAFSKVLDATTWFSAWLGTDWRPSLDLISIFEETSEFTGAAALFLSAVLCTLAHTRHSAKQQPQL